MKLRISDDLSLSADFITQPAAALGVRGSGKSNTAAVIVEELFGAGLPFCVVDPTSTWWGLRSSASGGPGLSIPIFGGPKGDVPLERGSGETIADLVAEERLSCVIDVGEFSEGDKTRWLADFAERLYRKNRDPLHLVLEEADDYVPQKPFREQARTLRAFQNIVRRGRARGLGITMVTQRSAVISKDVLTQAETLFVMRTTSPQDRKAVQAWVDYHGQSRDVIESLPTLAAGECWVWSPHYLGVMKRVRIRRRETFDSAATPKDVKGRRPPATLADVDLEAVKTRMSAAIEKAKQDDPRELRKTLAAQRQTIAELARDLEKAKGEKALERVEVPVLAPKDVEHLAKEVDRLIAFEQELLGKARGLFDEYREKIQPVLDRFCEGLGGKIKPLAEPLDKISEKLSRLNGRSHVEKDHVISDGSHPRDRRRDHDARVPPRRDGIAPARRDGIAPARSSEGLTGPEQRVLDALAELEALGVETPERVQVAFLAGYTNLNSKGFTNAIGALHTAGRIEYPIAGTIRLTDAGRDLAAPCPRPRSTDEIQRRVLDLLGGSHARVLRPLIEDYPKALERERVAAAAGYGNLNSKGFTNAIGRLRSLGFIDYPERGMVRAAPVLFLEGV